MKPLAFLRDTLWLGYALYFKPAELEERLRADGQSKLNPDDSLMQLGYITDYESSQPAARRYLAQIALWSAVAALPFLLLAREAQEPSSLLVLGLTLLLIWLGGLGVAVWNASRGVSAAAAMTILLGSQAKPDQWIIAAMGAVVPEILLQKAVPGILIGIAVGLTAYWIRDQKTAQARFWTYYKDAGVVVLAGWFAITSVIAGVGGFLIAGVTAGVVAIVVAMIAPLVWAGVHHMTDIGYSMVFIFVGTIAGILAVVAAGIMAGIMAGIDVEFFVGRFIAIVVVVGALAGALLFGLGMRAYKAFGVAFGMAVGAATGVFGMAIGAIVPIHLPGVIAAIVAIGAAVIVAIGLATAMAIGVLYTMPIAVAIVVAFGVTFGVAFGVTFGLAFGMTALPFLPAALLIAVGFLIGTSLSNNDTTNNIPWIRLGLLGVVGWVLLGSTPTSASLWFTAGLVGVLRLPVYAVEASICMVRYLRRQRHHT